MNSVPIVAGVTSITEQLCPQNNGCDRRLLNIPSGASYELVGGGTACVGSSSSTVGAGISNNYVVANGGFCTYKMLGDAKFVQQYMYCDQVYSPSVSRLGASWSRTGRAWGKASHASAQLLYHLDTNCVC